jgi:hypothetical protein
MEKEIGKLQNDSKFLEESMKYQSEMKINSLQVQKNEFYSFCTNVCIERHKK